MDEYKKQSRNPINGRWIVRTREESDVELDPEQDVNLDPNLDFIFAEANKPFEYIATLELHPDDAQVWANSDNSRVRLAVAANVSTSEEILHQLAQDTLFQIRVMVASNPSASMHTLHMLYFNDPVPRVVGGVKDRLSATRMEQVANHRYVVRIAYR